MLECVHGSCRTEQRVKGLKSVPSPPWGGCALSPGFGVFLFCVDFFQNNQTKVNSQGDYLNMWVGIDEDKRQFRNLSGLLTTLDLNGWGERGEITVSEESYSSSHLERGITFKGGSQLVQGKLSGRQPVNYYLYSLASLSPISWQGVGPHLS